MDIIAALLSFTCLHIPKIAVEPVCTIYIRCYQYDWKAFQLWGSKAIISHVLLDALPV